VNEEKWKNGSTRLSMAVTIFSPSAHRLKACVSAAANGEIVSKAILDRYQILNKRKMRERERKYFTQAPNNILQYERAAL
jgi:hypothetical protein